VVGHDLDRDAARCFRLSRIVGQVRSTGPARAFTPPADLDLISHVARWSGPIERTGQATVLLRPGRAAGVRRWAEEIVSGPEGDRVTLRFADAEGLASWLVGYGADVVVLDPPEVREAIVARLRHIVAELAGARVARAGHAPSGPSPGRTSARSLRSLYDGSGSARLTPRGDTDPSPARLRDGSA
jgi:proteasome accessory factor B